MADEALRLLDTGCEQLGIPLPPAAKSALTQYLDLLLHWNRRINLTAVRDRRQVVIRHLLDSIAVLTVTEEFETARGIDVGTGAGLPGLIMAILRPDSAMTLLDSNGKKTRFLFHVVSTLGLNNVTVVHSRVEQHAPIAPYDFVISRAYTDLVTMAQACGHLVDTGPLLAMKSAGLEKELEALPAAQFDVRSDPLIVPFLDETRCMVALTAQTGSR